MSVLLISVAFVFADDDAAAKKLYQTTEKKIQSAKSLKIEFKSELKGGERGFSIKGNLIVAAGNKVKFSVTFESGGNERKMSNVSDGKNLSLTQGDNTKTDPVPEKYGSKIQNAVAKLGPSMTMFTAVSPRAKKQQSQEASDFQLGKDEKIGKRNAKVLSYKLTRRTRKMQVKVWIDAKTGLPIKREIKPLGEAAKRGGTLVETSTFTLNPKVDAKTFKLPE